MSEDLPPPTDEPTGPAPDEIGAASIVPPSGADAVLPPERQLDQDGDEQNPDEIALTLSPQQMAVASTFYEVSLPGGMIGLYDTLFRTLQLHGESSPFNGGPMTEINGIEYSAARRLRSGDAESDDDDDDDMYVEFAEERHRERERREYERREQTIGNVTMTGAEWLELADELKRDGPLRQWLVGQIMANENKTREEAERDADQVALYIRMQNTPRDQWTDEMKALDRYLIEHPEVRADYDAHIDAIDQYRVSARGHESGAELASRDASRDNSLAAGASALDGVDAFELDQPGYLRSGQYPLGQRSRDELARLIAPNLPVVPTGAQTYGRPVVTAGGDNDVALQLLNSGMAIAAPDYLRADPDRLRNYMEAERIARLNRRGAFAGRFQAPQDYRHHVPDPCPQHGQAGPSGAVHRRCPGHEPGDAEPMPEAPA